MSSWFISLQYFLSCRHVKNDAIITNFSNTLREEGPVERHKEGKIRMFNHFNDSIGRPLYNLITINNNKLFK